MTTTRDPAAGASRLDFLDALRGLAVGLVLLQHVGELASPVVRDLAEQGVQLGQLGVMLFFLCSGFIIPASLERGSGAARAAHGGIELHCLADTGTEYGMSVQMIDQNH